MRATCGNEGVDGVGVVDNGRESLLATAVWVWMSRGESTTRCARDVPVGWWFGGPREAAHNVTLQLLTVRLSANGYTLSVRTEEELVESGCWFVCWCYQGESLSQKQLGGCTLRAGDAAAAEGMAYSSTSKELSSCGSVGLSRYQLQ